MARNVGRHGAARLEERIDAGEERAGVPGLAQHAIERLDHRAGGRIDGKLRAEHRVRDRYDEPRGHAVPRGIAKEDRQTPVRERLEGVEVAPDGVRNPVEAAELEGPDLGQDARHELRLELASHDELVLEVKLVDELHGEQEDERENRHEEREESPGSLAGPGVASKALDEREESEQEREGEDEPPRRR